MVFVKDFRPYRYTISLSGKDKGNTIVAAGLSHESIGAIAMIFKKETNCKKFDIELFNCDLNPEECVNGFFDLMYKEQQFSNKYYYVKRDTLEFIFTESKNLISSTIVDFTPAIKTKMREIIEDITQPVKMFS